MSTAPAWTGGFRTTHHGRGRDGRERRRALHGSPTQLTPPPRPLVSHPCDRWPHPRDRWPLTLDWLAAARTAVRIAVPSDALSVFGDKIARTVSQG